MSRGMKKFLPFSSLKEQASMLHEMEENKKKVEKPLISEDTQNEINRILNDYTGKTLLIYYYDRGYIKSLLNPITKIDAFNQVLVVKHIKIAFTNLLEIIDDL